MKKSTILPEDISQAIQTRLEEVFPGETVYTDLAPRDFKRPSNLIELEKLSLDPLSHGLSAVDLLYQYKITTFSTVDEVHASHLPVLNLRAMLAAGAFAAGFLRVKDRALKITSIAADTSLFDCAEIKLTLAVSLDRADFVEAELYDLMQTLELKLQAKEKRE